MLGRQMDFTLLLDKLDRAVLIIDESYNLTFLNAAAKRALKIPYEAETNKKLTDFGLLQNKGKEQLKIAMDDHLGIRLPIFIYSDREKNEIIEKELIMNPLNDKDSTTRLFVLEMGDTILASIEVERLRTLGTQTGDLAHAISNPLSVIQINCDTLEIESKKTPQMPSEKILQKVEKMGKALSRVTTETNQLKDMSRKLSMVSEENLVELFPPQLHEELGH